MSIVYLMLPLSLILGLGFLVAFIRMSASGQYDDLETPAHRMLLEDPQDQQPTKGRTCHPRS